MSTSIAVLCAATLILAGCSSRTVQNNGSGNTGGGATPCPPSPITPGPDQQVHLVWQQATNDWKVALGNAQPVAPAAAHTPLARCTGPTKFIVDIVGNTSASFKTQGGLDVWEGNNAKSQWKQGINSTQILGPVFTNDRKLVFYDLNQGNAATLNYQLNFNNGVKPVDPIVDNGGTN